MMGKLIVLLSLVFIYSCSSDEQDGANKNYKTTINPPAWIQGTWIDAKSQKFEFTNSNVTCNSNGNVYSAKGEISYYLIQDEDPEIIEEQTDSTYILQYKISASEKKNFSFIKISDVKIESKGVFKGIYTKK